MTHRVRVIAALALLLAAGGCAKRHRIQVQSDTCWDGIIDHQDTAHIGTCGDATYRVAGDIHCVVVQKQKADTGYLRIRIDEGPWSETTDPLGIVQVCR